jgi:hypothetical protein
LEDLGLDEDGEEGGEEGGTAASEGKEQWENEIKLILETHVS